MGTGTLKRFLRRKKTHDRKNSERRNTFFDFNNDISQYAEGDDANMWKTSTFSEHSPRGTTFSNRTTAKSRKGKGVVDLIRGSGTVVLRHFIATLGAETEASLNRGWVPGGTTLGQGTYYSYELRQGRDREEEKIRRLVYERSYRTGHRHQGGGWTRLVLGDEFTTEPSKKQIHELKVVLPWCACVGCRIASARGETQDDLDDMLAEAEKGEVFFEDQETPVSADNAQDEALERSAKADMLARARRLTRFGTLPSTDDFRVLGEALPAHEFELGTVSKITSRSAKVTFAPFARQFLQDDRYVGPMSMREISHAIIEHATQHYRRNKGKTTRRFYIHGWIFRFLIDRTGLVIFPLREDAPVGVIFRRQMMSVVQGCLALEDAFGAFLDTEHELFVGFGQDEYGAQSILQDGQVDEARHLGINELRMHCDIDAGDEIEVLLR